jgi:hypothetical protein
MPWDIELLKALRSANCENWLPNFNKRAGANFHRPRFDTGHPYQAKIALSIRGH